MKTKIVLVPYTRRIIGDLDTPVSVYLKLHQPFSFLLESVTGGDQVARYSFIGLNPFASLVATSRETIISADGHTSRTDQNAIDALEELMSRFHMDEQSGLPSFLGGAVGYFSWETIRQIEPVKAKKKIRSPYPMAHFMIPKTVVAFDHARREIILIVLGKKEEAAQCNKYLDQLENKLYQPVEGKRLDASSFKPPADPFKHVTSNYSKNDFLNHVNRVKQHIYEGDIFQLVLSQKFHISSDKDPFSVYRHLRLINPSPYMFYFDYQDYHIIGASPEILSKLNGRTATVRPIAGTRPRIPGREDELGEELRADEKERAEHIMLVDLGRNDLGRVCEYNSITCTEIMDIETYSHVLHMITNVTGTLKPDKNAFDLFRATFPAGTLSGAPKIRAIEIIEELEPEERGPYGGALGYFDFRGNMDLCIVIRTILASNHSFTVQAGAGIVADSEPEKEFEETRNKAKGMIYACL